MKTQHEGDCSFYSSLSNGYPEDGICTCGYAHKLRYNDDNEFYKQMYSEERMMSKSIHLTCCCGASIIINDSGVDAHRNAYDHASEWENKHKVCQSKATTRNDYHKYVITIEPPMPLSFYDGIRECDDLATIDKLRKEDESQRASDD